MIRLFRHYIPESMLLLGLGEAVLLVASVYLGVYIRFSDSGLPEGDPSGEWLFAKGLLFAAIVAGSMTTMGLYWRHLRVDSLWHIVLRLIGAFAVTVLVLALLFYILPELFIGRGALSISLLIAFGGVLATRALHYHFADMEALKARVLVVGAGRKASLLETLRRRVDWHGFKLVGYVHVRGERDAVGESKVIQSETPLDQLVDEYQIDEIVVAIDDRRKSFPVDEILECKMKGVQVVDLMTFFERQSGKIRLDTLHPSSLIFADGFSQAVLRKNSKRVFDVCASLFLLLFAWPVMLVTAMAIRLESPGSVLYRQVRVGRFGQPFEVLKFRSMRADAEKDGKAQWAQKGDSRVTRVGAFIRKFRIDELPQLLNVVRGDMSFVGPRPERPEFVEQLRQEIPFYDLRHKVAPGITGWAQISYPYGASVRDAMEKLQYDLYYIKNYSLLFDFMILFQTAHAVVWGKGAR